jgi:hypothetical protein
LLLLGVAGWLAMQFVPDAILQHPNVSVSAYAGLTPGLAAFLFILAREGIKVALGEEILEIRTKWGQSILDVVTLNLSLIIYAKRPPDQDHARQNTCMSCKKSVDPAQD